MAKVKVFRVLIYEGEEDVIRENLIHRSVKGSKHVGNFTIREAIIGGIDAFSTIIDVESKVINIKDRRNNRNGRKKDN